MDTSYLWLKSLHVVAIVAWMAGMLYLPRLFVYHADAVKGSVQSKTFAVMEKRLLRYIMTPALIVSWATGLWLAYSGGWFVAGWMHSKILLVVLMSGIHGYLAASVRKFGSETNTHSGKFFRVLNEAPTVLLIGIVVLVVVKPF